MSTAKVTFHRVDQNLQTMDGQNVNANHMLSRILFTLGVDGKVIDGMSAIIRQPYGTVQAEEIEVEPPLCADGKRYEGNWNHHEFRGAASAYYRGEIGPEGMAVRTTGSGHVNDVTTIRVRTFLITIPD